MANGLLHQPGITSHPAGQSDVPVSPRGVTHAKHKKPATATRICEAECIPMNMYTYVLVLAGTGKRGHHENALALPSTVTPNGGFPLKQNIRVRRI